MTNELKPCPFHEEPVIPRIETNCSKGNGKPGSGGWWAEVECPKCGVYMTEDECSTEEQAVDLVTAAWNTRYKRTCTMKNVEGAGSTSWLCSKCGKITWDHLYPKCGYCGAEVVDGD